MEKLSLVCPLYLFLLYLCILSNCIVEILFITMLSEDLQRYKQDKSLHGNWYACDIIEYGEFV